MFRRSVKTCGGLTCFMCRLCQKLAQGPRPEGSPCKVYNLNKSNLLTLRLTQLDNGVMNLAKSGGVDRANHRIRGCQL